MEQTQVEGVQGARPFIQSRGHAAMLLLVAIYTLAALGYSVATSNWEFVYYSLWLVVFVLGVLWMHRRVVIPVPILVGLAAWGAVHLAGGTIPIDAKYLDPGETNRTLYNMRVSPWLPKYDQVVHAYGFFVSTLAAWAGLRATYIIPPSLGFGLSLAVGLIGMGLGGMNEVIEFVGTLIFPNTNVGGYVNTGWDLVCNMTGCIAAVGVVHVWEARSRRVPRGTI
jgi:hypothetical protein